MCRFVETIRLQDHVPQHMAYHQQRYERTAKHFWGNAYHLENLADIADKWACRSGVNKIRIVYDQYGIAENTCEPYEMKRVETLRLVCCDDIDYTYKSTDRRALDMLAAQKENCDNVIVVRNGLLTDTSYTNIALYDGKHWHTPAKPLLPGTARARLLDENILLPREITPDEIQNYRYIALINAMIGLDDMVLPVNCVRH